METELYVSGIGGQGIQLVCKTLALAATLERRHAMLSAEYGGQMRGGSSRGTVVVGSGPLRALPVVAQACSAIALHTFEWEHVATRLRADSLIVAEAGIAEQLADAKRHRLIAIPAAQLAREAGNAMAAGMALMGAYNAITGIVSLDSLVAAMTQLLPPYRRQHIEINARALRLGAANAPQQLAPVNWVAVTEATS